jgi:UDP-2-acetamido-3-amino-2,3-dideoxy-glucuronate N-acetyltransferase
MKKRICVIGGGRWGNNHIKTLAKMGCLAAIAETNLEKLNELLVKYPEIKGYTDINEAVAAKYDGYTLATQAETHYTIGRNLIEKGLNVLMEKPMTLLSSESEELVKLAKKSGSRLMVGHVLLFHPAYQKIKEVIDSGKLGQLYYLYSTRLNLGTVRTEESVFSSFAPHDISILNYLTGTQASYIEAKGGKYLQENICDCTITQIEYPGNIHAYIFVSWLHPYKQQLLVVVGSKGMISFDDSTKEKEIHFYNKRIDFENGMPIKIEEPNEIIAYEKKMPLEEELRYFVEHLDSAIEINNGTAGYEAVKVLETVQKLVDR